jgi:SpoVK/Ycf46/Vps4 family AAA+-type ATPase
MDAAFESRIDLILPYDDLDEATRRHIWTNFVNTLDSGVHELCDADFGELSQQELNGREIKSVMKTALMLADSEGEKLQMEHLRTVLGVRQRAADYLHS